MHNLQELRALIERGKTEGELTYNDVVDAFRDTIMDIDAIDQIIYLLGEAGVDVIRPDDPLKERLVDALNTEGLSWMLTSSLTERAFWLGAYQSARLLGADSKTKNGLYRNVLNTLWERASDDTFQSTRFGRIHTELLSAVGREDVRLCELVERVDLLEAILSELSQTWQVGARDAQKLIRGLRDLINFISGPSGPATKRKVTDLTGIIQALETPLRQLSLLETSHKLQDRFK